MCFGWLGDKIGPDDMDKQLYMYMFVNPISIDKKEIQNLSYIFQMSPRHFWHTTVDVH